MTGWRTWRGGTGWVGAWSLRMPVMALSLLTLPLALSGCGSSGGDGEGSGGDDGGQCGPVEPPEDTTATCGNGVLEYGELCEGGPTGTCGLCQLSPFAGQQMLEVVIAGMGEAQCVEEEIAEDVFRTWDCGMGLGAGVFSMGDLDGDCLEDLGVRNFATVEATDGTSGDPEEVPEAYADGSAVRVYLGSTLLGAAGTTLSMDDADLTLKWESTPQLLGDVDGDGRMDLGVGPRVVLGKDVAALPRDEISTEPPWSYELVYEGVSEGVTLQRLGDFDLDGRDDLVLRVSTASDGVVYRLLSSEFFDSAVVGAMLEYSDISVSWDVEGLLPRWVHDLDGDGLRDLQAYATYDPSEPSRMVLISGAYLSELVAGDSLTLDPSHLLVDFVAFVDGAPITPSFTSDIDGDGRGDLVYRQAGYSSSTLFEVGRSWFVRASATDSWTLGETVDWSDAGAYEVVGTVEFERLIAGGTGDYDGDGLTDWIFWAPGNVESWGVPGGEAAGKTYLFRGASLAGIQDGATILGSEADVMLRGQEGYRHYGGATFMDLDGDGRDDMVFGNDDNGEYGPNGGKVHIIYSPF